jgi:O-antigen ligase
MPTSTRRLSLTAPFAAIFLLFAWWVTDHYPPWTSFHSELLAAVAGALAVGGALLSRRQAGGVCRTTFALLACALMPWAQWAGGVVVFRGDALLASLYLAGTALCYHAGQIAQASERDRLVDAIAAVMLTATILTTGVLLYQWFGLQGLNEILIAGSSIGTRAGGNLGQPNHTATLLCMGLAALLLFRTQGVVGNWAGVLAAIYIALGLALTQSRVPWLVFLLLTAAMMWRQQALFLALKLPASAVLSWFVAYALLFWAVGALPEAVFNAAQSDGNASRLGVGLRPILWGQWLEALRHAPWYGYGWMQGNAAQQAAALTRPGLEATDYSHSLPLDLLAWNGLPLGGLLVLAAVVWYIRAVAGAEGAKQAFRVAVVTALGAHSLVEYPFAYTYFLVPTALLAGQLCATTKSAAQHRAWPLVTLAVAATAILLGGIAVVRDYLRVEPDAHILREQIARVGGLRHTEPVRGLWVLDQMEALSRTSRIEPKTGMTRAELDDLLAAAHRFPNTLLLQQASLALASNGRLSEAHDQMRLLCALYGDGFYRITVARMSAIADEQGSSAKPFVASLMSLDTKTVDTTRNNKRRCSQR